MGVVFNVFAGIVGGSLGGWLLPNLIIGFGSGWLGFLVTAFIGAVCSC